MPFIKIPGFPGRIYVPKKQKGCCKKHPCKDCYACEFCSDDRCRICRDQKESVSSR